MERRMEGRRRPIWGAPVASLVLGSLASLLAACGGSGGGDDPSSPPPPPVPPGPPGIVVGDYDPMPGVNIVVVSHSGGSGPGGNFQPGDFLTVRFTVKSDAGIDLDVPSMSPAEICFSGPSNNYQRVFPVQDDVATASVYLGDGVWSYTFASPIPATYAAPINDPGGPPDVAAGQLKGTPLLDGTYTVGIWLTTQYEVDFQPKLDTGTGTHDLLVGSAGAILHREVVANANCNACHTDLRAHEGTRSDVRGCVLCHTAGALAGGTTPDASVEFKVMMHKLHNGAHLPSVLGIATTDPGGTRDYTAVPQPLEYDTGDGVEEFSEVAFPVFPSFNIAMPRNEGYSLLSSVDPDGTGPLLSPKARDDARRTGVVACAKCHGDPDGTGPDGPPAQGDLCYTQPARESCGSCHDDVDWTKKYKQNGQTMPENRVNGSCALCHAVSGDSLAVMDAHLHPLDDATIDGGVRTLLTSVTGGTGPGGNFQNGDAPIFHFAIQDDLGADLGLATMDACSAFFLGPTTNRQLVMPTPSPNGIAVNPFDFSGRLQASSTTGKGSMSKVFLGASAVAEVLVVQFTSSTAFSVTGTTSGALGTGTLPAATSTLPSGASISAFDIASGVSGGIVVTFDTPTTFTLSGAVSGSGALPASTNASTRYASASLSFNLSVGSTPFAVGNAFRLVVFQGGVANPVRFAVVAGTTAFASAAPAPDRFYYEVVPNAASYAFHCPMDFVFEDLGNGSGAPAQVFPALGNLPAYYGRQQVWETPLSLTVTTTSTGAVASLSRQMDVVGTTGWANGTLVVIEPLSGIGVREFALVAPARADGVIAAAGETTVRLYFKTPLRYAHASGVTVTKVTQTFRQEGAGNFYTLNPATGVITGVGAFSLGVPVVVSYRSDAKFGYRRHGGDALQTTYVPPANDSVDIGQEQGEWKGLPYLSGTYTADIWFARNVDLGLHGEVQTYRSTSNAGTLDFLYGSASEIVPHAIISDSANCYRCHNDVIFHGGGRRGLDACLTCHSTSGNEDKPRWDTPITSGTTNPTPLTPGIAIEFRQMLHKIHRGSGLANADTYTVVGNGGSVNMYGEIEFPAMPGGVMQCVKCHGNDAWHAPQEREHPLALLPTQAWGVVCGSCHDSSAAQAHIAVQTAPGGAESCAVCHGPYRDQDVVKVHFPR
jgi:hypothetical protein